MTYRREESIPEGWEYKQIKEIGEVVGGGTPKTTVKEYWNGDISWITPKDLSNYKQRYIYKGERSITLEGLENSSAKLLPKGTVLFSSRAPIGYVAIAGKELCTNQGFKSIVCNPEVVNNEFVYYLMKYNVPEIKQIASGSTFREISGGMLKEFNVLIPALEEQKVIAKMLADLDKKIEINNEIIEKLEKLAQAIFKHWFIDFEFPNENGDPYKSSGGKMIESELGNIPEGWSVQKLNNICEVTIGGDWGKESKEKDLVPAICLRGVDLQHIKENGFAGDAPVRWVKLNSVKKRTVSDNDILLGGSGAGPVGRSLYVHNSITNLYQYPIIYSNFCKRISAENKYVAYYVSEILHRMYITKEMNSFVTGTSVPNLDINSLMNVKIIVPKTKLLKIFYENIVDPMLRWKYSNENLILANIRDTLLPKLISGEIRVPVENE